MKFESCVVHVSIASIDFILTSCDSHRLIVVHMCGFDVYCFHVDPLWWSSFNRCIVHTLYCCIVHTLDDLALTDQITFNHKNFYFFLNTHLERLWLAYQNLLLFLIIQTMGCLDETINRWGLYSSTKGCLFTYQTVSVLTSSCLVWLDYNRYTGMFLLGFLF